MSNAIANKITDADTPAHEWYRFVLSYPPHLVREYLRKFEIGPGKRVLDPFCGTGTTIVECKKGGVASVGIESHPMAHFASRTKVEWNVNPEILRIEARRIASEACAELEGRRTTDRRKDQVIKPLRSLSEAEAKLILTGSISPLPLHKALVLRDHILTAEEPFRNCLLLAFATAAVRDFSNLRFGPEVGVTAPKADAEVVQPWLARVERMAYDLSELAFRPHTDCEALRGDARNLSHLIEPGSIDAVITSPPYPNEKDYTRTTRLESVLLGLVTDKDALQAVKRGLMRSNTRNVYKADDDDTHVEFSEEIQEIAREIEARRVAMGKTSGFERLYARVTKLYFGGMARHFESLKTVLVPGAKLAYVVGDQASYLRVMIRTGQLISMIAERHGYKTLGIDLFRTRLATATRAQLREEVVILELPKSRVSTTKST